MNIVITLQKRLIYAILDGQKKYEMRKQIPRHVRVGEDGFFCVEKGTKNVLCWCRIDKFLVLATDIDHHPLLPKSLAVSREYVRRYMKGKPVKLWKIGKVVRFEKPLELNRDLLVPRAPQSFAYTPLSYGESF